MLKLFSILSFVAVFFVSGPVHSQTQCDGEICGDGCCYSDDKNQQCCNNSHCCPKNACAGSGCCNAGDVVCNGGCCPNGSTCCGNYCCLKDHPQCCSGGCCNKAKLNATSKPFPPIKPLPGKKPLSKK